MTEDFLDTLRADWRQDGPDLAAMRRAGERRRRLTRLSMLLSLATAILAVALASWFGYRAARSGDALLILAAAALLVTVPLLIVEAIAKRRSLSLRYDGAPAGVLLQARHQAVTARRLLRGFRWSALILIACVAGAWVLAAAGFTDRGEALFLTGAWGGTASAVWLWQLWRGRRLAAEIACSDRLLAELAEAEGEDRPQAL